MKFRLVSILSCLLLVSFSASSIAAGFTTVTDWNETSVRKVLHSFAYGGFASDEQIRLWAQMTPELAINEILTFDAANPKLSPAEDSSAAHGYSLTSLQNFWGSSDANNPVRDDRRFVYDFLYTLDTGEKIQADPFLKNTWVQAATTRGINPFLHRVGFYLTNYHMAISISKTRPGLMRDFYDRTIVALQQGYDFIDVLAGGAMTAAVATAYGHQFNFYINEPLNLFIGNDDFAREFHQLYFRIQGKTEDQNYHENVTIENTAHALTGMLLDYSNPWGSSFDFDWAAAPINFSDHSYINGAGETVDVFNASLHHKNDLEILHTPISGRTAQEKIYFLARAAGYHPESLDNIPVTIIDYFADDNLTTDKIATIREAWRAQEPKLLLEFLRSYAISSTFHRADTVKYRSAFDRNLLVYNFNTIDNIESFARGELPIDQMLKEGADVFQPAHDVFGGQTGLQAANNPNIFREAFQRNVQQIGFLGRTSHEEFPPLPVSWQKDWSKLAPKGTTGLYDIKTVADWLWQRFIGDGGKNLGIQEKAQIYAMLASGADYGYLVDAYLVPGSGADQSFSSAQLQQSPYIDLVNYLANLDLKLDSPDPLERREANRRVGMAVNFITITPFIFAMEGK